MTILIIVVGIEAFVLGWMIGYLRGRRASNLVLTEIENEMDNFVKMFNTEMENLYQVTGHELPKLPTREEVKNGRNR